MMYGDESISSWQERVHALNVKKGFYDYESDINYLETQIARTDESVHEFVTVLKRVLKDYKQALVERKLLLAIGEICEAHEELRAGHRLDEVYYNADNEKPEGFPIEIADAQIRLLDVAEASKFSSELSIEEKHAYNTTRPYRHGKVF